MLGLRKPCIRKYRALLSFVFICSHIVMVRNSVWPPVCQLPKTAEPQQGPVTMGASIEPAAL